MDQRQGSAKDAGWWVLQTKPLSEKRAQANLVAQGYGVFLPEYPREFIRGRKRHVRSAPLFPRYLFIQVDDHAQRSQHSIRHTRGVSMRLMVAGVPAVVTSAMILALQTRVAELSGTAASAFTVGAAYRIASGPLQGVDALFQEACDETRAWMLVTLLGRETRVAIAKALLS